MINTDNIVTEVDEARRYIEGIAENIRNSREERVWKDVVRAVSIISDLVFTRSSHFIMEFIQNAEDAGADLKERIGELEIRISGKRVLVINNARLFTRDDVDAICGLRTTKNPALGSIGYLGIGFKSVYKITESPHIFSGVFRFKFDKNYWQIPENRIGWGDPREIPWQIIPIWVDECPEEIYKEVSEKKTVFYLPLKNAEAYNETVNEVKRLGVYLFLFLRWIKKIRIIIEDGDNSEKITLENLGRVMQPEIARDTIAGGAASGLEDERNGIFIFGRNGLHNRFLIFRKKYQIPEAVRKDSVTESAARSEVTCREVIIAFKLDDRNRLVPITGRDVYGSVYSFLPLGEERIGSSFLIQGDFIVTPGREAINYEAAWNKLIVEKIEELTVEVIENVFKNSPEWRKQYLKIFNFTPYYGQPTFDKLFYPLLYKPLMDYLLGNNSIPTHDNRFVTPDEGVIVSEDIFDLISDRVLEIIYPDSGRLSKISPDTELGILKGRVKKLDILYVIRNVDFLKKKVEE